MSHTTGRTFPSAYLQKFVLFVGNFYYVCRDFRNPWCDPFFSRLPAAGIVLIVSANTHQAIRHRRAALRCLDWPDTP